MLQTTLGTRGMVTAPHALAAQAGLDILRRGGNAIEAMLAAAAAIAVVYPHMNSIGGDGFWTIVPASGEPLAISACGGAAAAATIEAYRARGMASVPARGPWAANTVAGTVGGWQAALGLSQRWGGRLPLSLLLSEAIRYAEEGIPVTVSQSVLTAKKRAELQDQPGFADTFLPQGRVPSPGELFLQPRLARTLRRLGEEGLESFYRGSLGADIAADLARIGSPVAAQDLAGYRAQVVTPLRLAHACGELFNMTLPTQGVVSLAILGIAERAGLAAVTPDSADFVHLLVESTKQAFSLRDRYVTDPGECPLEPQSLLDSTRLDGLAAAIRPDRAAPWGAGRGPADTIWMGAIDDQGLAVSFIQSIYHEYGSGCVLPETGINWQNRGASFSLDPSALLALRPGKRPFHTLNPAAARLSDGRVMVYGTMGGDGQPQTQAAVFTRYAVFGQPLQQAVTAPRWLLGRTWGQTSDTLKLETRFPGEVVNELRARGHEVELLQDFDETVGHAGAVVRHPDGGLEGATDPRSNGGVAAY
ncbi:MAG: gamma-glutamyltransferase family protein [Betaproteobacteria bacterium]|nr:gamma-glutamyltransferase family protein [Betaproteobacteria bacterium]